MVENAPPKAPPAHAINAPDAQKDFNKSAEKPESKPWSQMEKDKLEKERAKPVSNTLDHNMRDNGANLVRKQEAERQAAIREKRIAEIKDKQDAARGIAKDAFTKARQEGHSPNQIVKDGGIPKTKTEQANKEFNTGAKAQDEKIDKERQKKIEEMRENMRSMQAQQRDRG